MLLSGSRSLGSSSWTNIFYHMAKMTQLRHVPDTLHRQLKARAAMAGLSLSDFLVREVRKIAELLAWVHPHGAWIRWCD